MESVDAVVVGAGVVGLAIARTLAKRFDSVVLLERNDSFGEETSSRNSEVIHAGIYYPCDSLKAKLCVRGKALLYEYCEHKSIPYKKIGKLIVANEDLDIEYIESITQQAKQNGVDDLVRLASWQLKKYEPNVRANSALLSPSTGIIDVHSFMNSLLNDFERFGGIFANCSTLDYVRSKSEEFILDVTSVGQKMKLKTNILVNSAGLQSASVAHKIDRLESSLIPELHLCRGHYFTYSGKSPFGKLIYPVPTKAGLGIHGTLDLGGQLRFGPDTEYIDEIDYVVDSNLKDKFYRAIKGYFPSLQIEKLHPAYSGIRPKLQGPKDGFKDFQIQTSREHGVKNLINLFGIESPGLTSSLAIAEVVNNEL